MATIAENLTILSNHLEDAYTAIGNKGGTVPSQHNATNLSAAIDTIQTGGGGSSRFNLTIENILPAVDAEGGLDTSTSPAAAFVATGYTQPRQSYEWVNRFGSTQLGAPSRALPNISSITFPDLSSIPNGVSYLFNRLASNNPYVKEIDFPELATVGSQNTSQAFSYIAAFAKGLKRFSASKLSSSTINGFMYAFRDATALEECNLSSLTRINSSSYIWYGCTSLKSVNLANLTSIDGSCTYTFTNCRALSSIDLPNLKFSNMTTNSFQNCGQMLSVNMPQLTSWTILTASTAYQLFSGCSSVKYFNLSSITNDTTYSQFFNSSSMQNIEYAYLGTSATSTKQWSSQFWAARNLKECHFTKYTSLTCVNTSGQFQSFTPALASEPATYTKVVFDEVTTIGLGTDSSLWMFKTCYYMDLYFPKLQSFSNSGTNLVHTNNSTNQKCRIHFPASARAVVEAQPGYENKFSDNPSLVTIYFDL